MNKPEQPEPPPHESLGSIMMQEVCRYNDGNGCTRRELVDNLLIAAQQHFAPAHSEDGAKGHERYNPQPLRRERVSEPTPRPWYDIPHPKWAGADHRISSHPDADWAEYGHVGSVGASNAALICEAVNSHDALTARVRELESERNDPRSFMPQLYGDFFAQFGFYPPCESHEWDNRTSAENFVWIADKVTALTEERDNLRRECDEEVDEFNAGFQAYQDSLSDDAPRDDPHDVWLAGYAWAAYQDLKREVATLTDQLSTARRDGSLSNFIWTSGDYQYVRAAHSEDEREIARQLVDAWDRNNGMCLLGDHRDDLILQIEKALARPAPVEENLGTMTHAQLIARMKFHRSESARYSEEAGKAWRLRVRTGNASEEDKQRAAACAEQLLPTAPPASEQDNRPSCWHCGVILAYTPKLRCEDCPDECDTENCDAFGCAEQERCQCHCPGVGYCACECHAAVRPLPAAPPVGEQESE